VFDFIEAREKLGKNNKPAFLKAMAEAEKDLNGDTKVHVWNNGIVQRYHNTGSAIPRPWIKTPTLCEYEPLSSILAQNKSNPLCVRVEH